MTRRATRSIWALAASLLLSPIARGADECAPSSGISSCVNATSLWLPPGRPELVAIASGRPIAEDSFAFGAGFVYSSRPIVLLAPSPDPDGREIRVVDHRVDLSLSWAYAPSERLELTLVTPMVLHQTGAGAEGVTSQDGAPLPNSAAHDPRLGAGFALIHDRSLGLKLRGELSAPLGSSHLFAGERWFVFAPSLAGSLRLGRFFAASELGVRLRKTTHVATASHGSELVGALGAGVHILDDELLSFGVEALAAPSLVAQDRARSDATLVGAEWLASVRSAPLSDRAFRLELAGGTGLPLSTRVDENGDEQSELGLATPRFRLIFGVRYAPEG